MTLPIFSSILAAAIALPACVNDLNTLPLDKTEPISEYVYGADEQAYMQGLARLYFQFASNDLTDLLRYIVEGGDPAAGLQLDLFLYNFEFHW